MAVRSRRLGDGIGTTTGATIFTVPADRTAIVKEVCLQNGGAVAATVYVAAFPGGGITGYYVALALVPAAGMTRVPAWFVMHETDVLKVVGPAGNTTAAYVSGTLLLGDPA